MLCHSVLVTFGCGWITSLPAETFTWRVNWSSDRRPFTLERSVGDGGWGASPPLSAEFDKNAGRCKTEEASVNGRRHPAVQQVSPRWIGGFSVSGGCGMMEQPSSVSRGRFRAVHQQGGLRGPLFCYHVPSSHEVRYFSCSSVSSSMVMPIEASLRRATSLSISRGTS